MEIMSMALVSVVSRCSLIACLKAYRTLRAWSSKDHARRFMIRLRISSSTALSLWECCYAVLLHVWEEEVFLLRVVDV